MQPIFAAGSRIGFFQPEAHDHSQTRELPYPICLDGSSSCRNNRSLQAAVDPETGATYPIERATLFDRVSYSGSQFSGNAEYDCATFTTPPALLSPRFGFALGVFGNGRT